MCFAPLPNVLRPLHLILARCHFWSFLTFFLDFLTLMIEISTRGSSGRVLDYFLDKTWSYLLQTHFVLLNSKNSSISVDFCIFAQNHENQALSLVARSSSGWVFMTLKVLPSKSSWSQDYFTYLSCCHISHRSQVTTLFMTKFNSLLNYIHIFQIWSDVIVEAFSGQEPNLKFVLTIAGL